MTTTPELLPVTQEDRVLVVELGSYAGAPRDAILRGDWDSDQRTVQRVARHRLTTLAADTVKLERVLSSHWVTDTGCQHYEDGSGDNQFACWCGWVSDRVPNVGEGVRAWAKHVTQALAEIEASQPKEIG